MPNQVIPLTQLDKTGLIEDMPSVSLPPAAFSDVQNVRFDDGAVHSMKDTGAQLLPPEARDLLRYAAYWPSPTGDKYIVVSYTDSATLATIEVFAIVNEAWAELTENMTMPIPTGTTPEWQHTIFNGGYHLVLNNGVTTPRYLQDNGATAVPIISELPGWDSYAAERVLMNFEADGSGGAIEVETTLLEGTRIKITNTPRNTALPIVTETVTVNAAVNRVVNSAGADDGTLAGIGSITDIGVEGFTFIPNDGFGGNSFRIAIVSAPVETVTAGVVRAYGNLLIAGNLREVDEDGSIRTLTGTIRTSDVAGPGEIPQNWNPFSLGVNTADEFILASTGTVMDMAELQGVMYVYTDSSIHSIQQTGNDTLPFQISPVTNNYGVDRLDGVIEVDGKHIVCGSNDVYVFAGHPGSIASIADGRVRDSVRNMKVVRYNKFDELWFYGTDGTAGTDRAQYIWDYRNDVWTKRFDNTPRSIDSDRDGLLIVNHDNLVARPDEGPGYLESYVERRRLAMSPEFDTETLVSVALLVDGTDELGISVEGTNAPGIDANALGTPTFMFDISDNYKTDIRVHGRFLNYRISGDGAWRLSGIQLDIGKGGQR